MDTLYCDEINTMTASKTFPFVLLIIAFVSLQFPAICQDTKKENPIIFFDEFVGGAFGNAGGLAAGLGLNYQVDRHLITARILGTVKFGADFLDPWIPLPIFNVKNSMGKVALLYGLREIEDNYAYSFSLGVSYNGYFQNYDKYVDNTINYDYFGVPFEANIKWFKREKKPYRIIYGLIPIGPPTGFGRSIGFKIFGNISKQSYVGAGLSFGLGFHKVYH